MLFTMTTTQEIKLEHNDDAYIVTDKHHYIVLNMTIHSEWEDCNEVGSIALLNLISGELEEVTIWCGNEEGNYFYVCLPTDEYDDNDEEILDVTSIEFFGTDISSFKELSKMGKYKATLNFLEQLKYSFVFSVSFLEAYRTLRDANQVHLYDTDGLLLSNEGIY